MHVPGHDVVDEAGRQSPGEFENLAAQLAGGQVERVFVARAAAAGVRRDDHQLRPGLAQARGLALDRRRAA